MPQTTSKVKSTKQGAFTADLTTAERKWLKDMTLFVERVPKDVLWSSLALVLRGQEETIKGGSGVISSSDDKMPDAPRLKSDKAKRGRQLRKESDNDADSSDVEESETEESESEFEAEYRRGDDSEDEESEEEGSEDEESGEEGSEDEEDHSSFLNNIDDYKYTLKKMYKL